MMSGSHLACNAASLGLMTGVRSYAVRHTGDLPDFIRPAVAGLTAYVLPEAAMPGRLQYLVAAAVLYVLGTLLPDVDNRRSMLGRFVYIPVGHRTFTHSIWPVIAFLVLSIRFRPAFWLASGYALHLFWDSFSACGVCWFWPFSKYRSYPGGAKVKARRVLLGLYHAGETSERAFVAVACAACVAAGAWLWLA